MRGRATKAPAAARWIWLGLVGAAVMLLAFACESTPGSTPPPLGNGGNDGGSVWDVAVDQGSDMGSPGDGAGNDGGRGADGAPIEDVVFEPPDDLSITPEDSGGTGQDTGVHDALGNTDVSNIIPDR
jgi:hypothetical protein